MAYVLSSISGNLISAASAGFAPTNGADVSAIASAYQVVSATATQLNAGTAYLTSVNETPISAARAGNAANASLATSAWYDGTGRLISSLPDEATVSSIASAYAESAVSSKQDTLTFGYDDSAISSINGSALAGGGGATGDYVEKSATEVAIGSGNVVSATSFAFGENNSADSRAFALGSYCDASASSIALGSGSRASTNSISVGYSGYSKNRSLSLGNRASANMDSIAAGNYSKAGDNSLAVGNAAVAALGSIAVGSDCNALCGYARGNNNSGTYAFMDGTSLRCKSATAFGTCNLSGNNDSAVFVIGDGTDSATGRHDLMTISRDGEITLYSSTADTVGTGIMSSIRAISAAATGGVEESAVSAIASSYAESAMSSKLDESATADFYSTSNPSGFITGVDLSDYATTTYVDSSVSSKLDTTAYNSAEFYSTSNPSGFITGVDLSDYATTAYVDSSVSSKLDTTAYNSSDFYSTSNPSGFIDSAYVDSAVSGKADSSAMSSYVPYSSLEYNTASAISGINGSALAAGSTYTAGEGIDITDDVISVEAPVDIVAGPGIVIDNPDGNTLRVSVAQDVEVELFSGTATNTNVALSEALDNFERIKIYAYWKGTNTYDYYGYSVTEIYTSELSVGKRFTVNVFCNLNDSEFYSIANFSVASTKTQLNLVNVKRASLTEQLIAQNDGPTVYKVIGVHRIANN